MVKMVNENNNDDELEVDHQNTDTDVDETSSSDSSHNSNTNNYEKSKYCDNDLLKNDDKVLTKNDDNELNTNYNITNDKSQSSIANCMTVSESNKNLNNDNDHNNELQEKLSGRNIENHEIEENFQQNSNLLKTESNRYIDNKILTKQNDKQQHEQQQQQVDLYKDLQDIMVEETKKITNEKRQHQQQARLKNEQENKTVEKQEPDEYNGKDEHHQQLNATDNADLMNTFLSSTTTTTNSDIDVQEQHKPLHTQYYQEQQQNTINYAQNFAEHQHQEQQQNNFQGINYHQQHQQPFQYGRDMQQYAHQNFFLMHQQQQQPPPIHHQEELFLEEQQRNFNTMLQRQNLLIPMNDNSQQTVNRNESEQLNPPQQQQSSVQQSVPMHEGHDDGYETCAGDVVPSNCLLPSSNNPEQQQEQQIKSMQVAVPTDDLQQSSNYNFQEQLQQRTQTAIMTGDINSVYEQQQHDTVSKCHATNVVANPLLRAPQKRRGRKKKVPIDEISLQDKIAIDTECFSEIQENNDDIGDFRVTQGLISQEKITIKERKRHDRFNGMPEEEVVKRTLPDHLCDNLDIVIVGINPGLFAAYKGHHYAGPGNHFWKCLYLSGITQEQMSADEDYKLLRYGIGFTNMVQRATKGSADLTRKEIKEGSRILLDKLQRFRPKIVVFNGKLIFEVFSGKKEFNFGHQPECVEGTNTHVWVMPSSSARCAQLPRAADKVPFYAALKKYRDYLNGLIENIDMDTCVFSEERIKSLFGSKESQLLPYNDVDNDNSNNDNQNNLTDLNPTLEQKHLLQHQNSLHLLNAEKKKRGRPKKIKLDQLKMNTNFMLTSEKNHSDQVGDTILNLNAMQSQSHGENTTSGIGLDNSDATTAALLMGGNLITTPTKKKRGRPKKLKFSNDLLQQQQQQQHYISTQAADGKKFHFNLDQQQQLKTKNNGLYPHSPSTVLSPYCDTPPTPTTLPQHQQSYDTIRSLTPTNMHETVDLPQQPSPPNSPNICAVDFEPPNPANAATRTHHHQRIMSPISTDLMQQHHYSQHQHPWLITEQQQQQHFQYINQQEQQHQHMWQTTTQQQYDAYQSLTASLLHHQQHQLQQQTPTTIVQHCDVATKSISGLESLVDQIPTKSTTATQLNDTQLQQQHVNIKSSPSFISHQHNGSTSPQHNDITVSSAIGENLLYSVNRSSLGTPPSTNSGSTPSTPSLAASPISSSTYGITRLTTTKLQTQQSPLHLNSPASCSGGGALSNVTHSAAGDVSGNNNNNSGSGAGTGFYSDFSVSNLVATTTSNITTTTEQQYTKIYSPHHHACFITCATPTPTPTPPMTPTTTTASTSQRLPSATATTVSAAAVAFRPSQTQNVYNILYDNQQFITDYQLNQHQQQEHQHQQQLHQQHHLQNQQQHHLQAQQHHGYADMELSGNMHRDASLAYTHAAHHMATYSGYGTQQQQSGQHAITPTVVSGYHHQTHPAHLQQHPPHMQPHAHGHHHHLSFNLSSHHSHHHHTLNTLNHHTHPHAHPHAHHLSMFEFERFKGTDIGTYGGF